MNFFHNRITYPTGGGPTFAQWLEQFMSKTASTDEEQIERTAAEAKPGTGMDMSDEPRGAQRGQVINNDNEEGAGQSYQDGESVNGKPDQGGNARKDTGGTTEQKKETQTDKEAQVKEAECGKEMGESDDAGKVTEEHTEAGPGNDADPEPKVLINNDPNYQKGESTDPAKATGEGKKGPGDPVVGKGASTKIRFEKIASMPRLKKLYLFAMLSRNKNNLVGAYPLHYVEEMVGMKFANMTPEEKTWFKDFWETMYDAEYVADMVQDR